MADEQQLRRFVEDAARRYLDRVGGNGFTLVEQHLGKRIRATYFVDGEVVPRMAVSGVGFALLRKSAHQEHGRPWYTATGTFDAEGRLDLSCEYDAPPADESLRTVVNDATDLQLFPRPPELVPGWMKVELAAVGAWDLRADRLTVDEKWQPVGDPQTPESAGVAPPPGAELAHLP